MVVGNIKLYKERIILREFIYEDWIDVHNYASLQKVTQYQPWGPNTKEESKKFVAEVINDASMDPRTRYAFAIEVDSMMVGTGEINVIDFSNKTAELSYIVNPNYWGKNIATDTSKLLIEFGFKTLNLHRIYATCDPRNIASARVLEKVGMTKEGTLRENLKLMSGWRDSYLYSLLVHE